MSEITRDEFPTTHWSQVALAADDDTAVRDEALRRLLRQYVRPMQVHLRLRLRLNPDAADEIVQDFLVSKVIGHRLFARAERGKGRFRTYLLTALDRFASNALRKGRALPRESLDETCEPADPKPDAAAEFEAAWAREVLGLALRRMQEECHGRGRDDVWEVFDSRVIAPALAGEAPVPYEALVEKLRLASPAEGSNLLATAKRSFMRALRAVVGEYEESDVQVDEEIASLRAALSRRRR